jgi:nitrite reductase/ring-hydroxylating ferredoxin subunit
LPDPDASPDAAPDDEGWLDVASEADVPEGRPLLLNVEGVALFVYRTPERVYVLSNTCTHMGGPLNRGLIGSLGHEPTITCPFHGSLFRLSDGRVIRGPAMRPQPVFDARIVDGTLQIRDRG